MDICIVLEATKIASFHGRTDSIRLLGQLHELRSIYDSSLNPKDRTVDETIQMANAHNNIGASLLAESQWDKALPYLE